jgi:hypothetical protein
MAARRTAKARTVAITVTLNRSADVQHAPGSIHEGGKASFTGPEQGCRGSRLRTLATRPGMAGWHRSCLSDARTVTCPRSKHAALRHTRPRRLAGRAAGQPLRRGRRLLLGVHQPVRACLHAPRLSRGLSGNPQRPPARQPRRLEHPRDNHGQARQRRNRNRGPADRRPGGIRQPVPSAPAMAAAMAARDAARSGRAARIPAQPVRVESDPVPIPGLRARRAGLHPRRAGNARRWLTAPAQLNHRPPPGQLVAALLSLSPAQNLTSATCLRRKTQLHQGLSQVDLR